MVKKIFLLLCLVINVDFCYSMNEYCFNSAKIDKKIDQASCVRDLLPLVTEQLGVARFIAERVRFDDNDSYMCARYSAHAFAYNYMVDFFYRDQLVRPTLHIDVYRVLKQLRELNIFDDTIFAMVTEKYKRNPITFARCCLAPYTRIDDRKKWLYHLTTYHQQACQALKYDKSFKQASLLIASAYLLTQFSSDLGGLLCVERDTLDQQSVLKQCLQNTNHLLHGVLTVLCRKRKMPRLLRVSPLIEITSYAEPLPHPTSFCDSFYRWYYSWCVSHDVAFPLKFLVDHYGVYDMVNVVPEPD